MSKPKKRPLSERLRCVFGGGSRHERHKGISTPLAEDCLEGPQSHMLESERQIALAMAAKSPMLYHQPCCSRYQPDTGCTSNYRSGEKCKRACAKARVSISDIKTLGADDEDVSERNAADEADCLPSVERVSSFVYLSPLETFYHACVAQYDKRDLERYTEESLTDGDVVSETRVSIGAGHRLVFTRRASKDNTYGSVDSFSCEEDAFAKKEGESSEDTEGLLIDQTKVDKSRALEHEKQFVAGAPIRVGKDMSKEEKKESENRPAELDVGIRRIVNHARREDNNILEEDIPDIKDILASAPKVNFERNTIKATSECNVENLKDTPKPVDRTLKTGTCYDNLPESPVHIEKQNDCQLEKDCWEPMDAKNEGEGVQIEDDSRDKEGEVLQSEEASVSSGVLTVSACQYPEASMTLSEVDTPMFGPTIGVNIDAIIDKASVNISKARDTIQASGKFSQIVLVHPENSKGEKTVKSTTGNGKSSLDEGADNDVLKNLTGGQTVFNVCGENIYISVGGKKTKIKGCRKKKMVTTEAGSSGIAKEEKVSFKTGGKKRMKKKKKSQKRKQSKDQDDSSSSEDGSFGPTHKKEATANIEVDTKRVSDSKEELNQQKLSEQTVLNSTSLIMVDSEKSNSSMDDQKHTGEKVEAVCNGATELCEKTRQNAQGVGDGNEKPIEQDLNKEPVIKIDSKELETQPCESSSTCTNIPSLKEGQHSRESSPDETANDTPKETIDEPNIGEAFKTETIERKEEVEEHKDNTKPANSAVIPSDGTPHTENKNNDVDFPVVIIAEGRKPAEVSADDGITDAADLEGSEASDTTTGLMQVSSLSGEEDPDDLAEHRFKHFHNIDTDRGGSNNNVNSGGAVDEAGFMDVFKLKEVWQREGKTMKKLIAKHRRRDGRLERLHRHIADLRNETAEMRRLVEEQGQHVKALRNEAADMRTTLSAVCDESVAGIAKDTEARSLEPTCYRRYTNIRTPHDAINLLASVRSRMKALGELEVLIYRKQLVLQHVLPSSASQERVSVPKKAIRPSSKLPKQKKNEEIASKGGNIIIEVISPSPRSEAATPSWSDEVTETTESPMTVSVPFSASNDVQTPPLVIDISDD